MSGKRIACWMSEKKLQKLNWAEFEKTCERYGYSPFKLDLNKDLESQGPFCVLLHKLTDIIAAENQGDQKCASLMFEVQSYLVDHPEVVVVDPIPNVRRLLNRYVSYSDINLTDLREHGIFTPTFCELTELEPEELASQVRASGVTYPFISKPCLGHGSRQAHEMAIVFSERGLADCRPPGVAQSFVNHDAVLYKIFVVGEKHCWVERPSLKNFQACDDATIYFDSSDVSKAGSRSSLSVLDPRDAAGSGRGPDHEVLALIARSLRTAFGMDLLGIDVVIENSTGRYAIIDVNAYPGYDGFPDFFDALLQCIDSKVKAGGGAS